MSTRAADSTISELETSFLKRTPWQDWTPTVTQGVAVTFNTTFARYVVLGDTVLFRARLAITSAGTIANAVIIGGLPLSIADASGIVGTIRIIDTGTANYVGALFVVSATTLEGVAHGLGLAMGVTPAFALANGDTIDLVGQYEW